MIPDFSIIIPIYNSEKTLERCIESALSQTDVELELILIDDGSIDNSFKICKQYAKNDSRIKLIHQENKGLSISRNIGLKVATGNYIVFLDSDDYLSNKLYSIKKHLNSSNSEIVGFNVNVINQKGECVDTVPALNTEMKNKVVTGKEYIEIYKNQFQIPVWMYIYEKSFLIKNQLAFLENVYHEDCNFTVKCMLMTSKISYIEVDLYNYYRNDVSITGVFKEKRCYDLIIVSQKIQEYAFGNQSRAVKECIQNYSGYLMFAAIHLWVQNKNNLSSFFLNKDQRNSVVKALKLNSRYAIIANLLIFKLDSLVYIMVKFLDVLRKKKG